MMLNIQKQRIQFEIDEYHFQKKEIEDMGEKIALDPQLLQIGQLIKKIKARVWIGRI